MAQAFSSFYLAAEEGPSFWFINSLVTIKATTEATGGALSLVHQIAPAGFSTPYHAHPAEDETFYLLDGEVTFFSDGKKVELKSGASIFLPRGTPHGFRIQSPGPATMLVLSTPGGQFVDFVQEMGTPAAERVLPSPTAPDIPRLLATSVKYGSEVIGPLPG